MTEILGWGLAIVGVFWLLFLPYFLLVGILHKWGYHALCRMKCEVSLQAANVRAEMQEQFKAGMRQGMKGRATFGAEQSTEMAVKHSLLPNWTHADGESAHLAQVKDKYAELRLAFDAIDDPTIAAQALAVAVGCVAKQTSDPELVLNTAHTISAEYAGIGESDPAAAG